MNVPSQQRTIVLGLLGAVAGGCLGFVAFVWIAQQGFYALLLPPVLLGLGAGLCVRRRSNFLAAVCGVAGLALGLFSEWRIAPFVDDGSFVYFITHVYLLRPITMIMLVLGTFISYRLALGCNSDCTSPNQAP